MLETLRDSAAGHLLRWASGGRLLPHAEDVDPNLWRMYVSTEKSKNLEPLAIEIEKNHHKSRKLRKNRNKGAVTASKSDTGRPETRATPAPPTVHDGIPRHTQTDGTGALPTPDAKATQQAEGEPHSENVDKESPIIGGNIDTAGTWNTEDSGQVWLHNENLGSWSSEDTPRSQSTADTPQNGSSTALLSAGGHAAHATRSAGDLEQGWVTAATGQEGVDITMQQAHVDGDPALQLHSESNDTAWNAVQLEAGKENVPTVKDVESDPAAKRVVNVVVWFGPDDPANPVNWSHAKRAFVTAQIYLLTVCTYIGTSIFSPGSHNAQHHFGVGEVAATLGTSLGILGYGLGVMIWSPMSEAIRLGRKPVYLVTLTIFVGLQIPTVLAKNFGMLLAFRLLSGIFGAPVLAIGGASINDMYPPTQRGYAIILWDVVSIAAPGKWDSSITVKSANEAIVLGPLIGGFAANANGWRWTIWTLMWLSAGSLVFFLLFMPETNPSNILYRRSRRLRVLTGNQTLRSEQDVLGGQLSLAETLQRLFGRPFVLCFTEPILLVINVYIALLNAVLFGSLDSFPLVFEGIYGFNLGQVGLAFLGLFVGSVLALPPMFYYLRYGVSANASGEVKPEKRLPPAIVGAFLVPISLFMFGWTAKASVHWIVPIVASGFFGVAIVVISYANLNYLPDAYPTCAASVLAGNECMRSTASAIFPLFTAAMYTNLGIGWASALLALLSCVFIPVPIVLFYYGHIIRGWSKRAKQDF
ncbi:MAG: hypothetical protein Q9201_000696 [Fulgogasparrea decipioides]